MANELIKSTAKENKIYLWQIAEALGITDSHFSKKLRKEFSETERNKIMNIISELKSERNVAQDTKEECK